ncbi:MAG: hypothetical protein ABI645_01095 [Pseudomonadota bacterium]
MKRSEKRLRPKSDWCHRYTVEIKDLATGQARMLQLKGMCQVQLKPKAEPAESLRREYLVVEDGNTLIEAPDFESLRIVLREKYPDSGYERRLHVERDRAMELAWDSLRKIFVDAAVEEMLKEMKNPGQT